MQLREDGSRPVRVVIVDDTRTIRAMIRAMLETSPLIEVVGEAGDPYEARKLIREVNPDVITLDVVMPKMDGLSFLRRLMDLRPMPVVMVSSRTTENSREAITALSMGAVDCIDLGQLRQSHNGGKLAETVLMAAGSSLQGMSRRARRSVEPVAEDGEFDWNRKVVVIGSSTGGVDALLRVLSTLPGDCPPIVIAQHMPSNFLESFARRLERNCRPTVGLSEDGARLRQGHIYLGAGGDVQTVLSETDPFTLHHIAHDGVEEYVPSVNLLFASAVPHTSRVVGVMLTGMGRDGADAMLRMREAGAHTIVQDGASAVIDGMPRAARENGAAIEVADLSKIGARILASTGEKSRADARPL